MLLNLLIVGVSLNIIVAVSAAMDIISIKSTKALSV